MLEKTFEIIRDIKPATFIPDNEICFDEAEVTALGSLLQRLVYAPSQIRRHLQKYGVTIVPSNFYSEVPTIDEIEEAFAQSPAPTYDLIFDDKTIRNSLSSMMRFTTEFSPPDDPDIDTEFFWNNSQFSYSDAMAYYCMIRLHKPQTIVEIGSGFSTLVALEAMKRNRSGKVICVEPYPRDFMHKLDIKLVKSKVQQLSPNFFNEHLTDGDFLFIDSTHTVKHGSDCLKIYLEIVPKIKKRVLVHAHDIFLPRTLNIRQLRDEQIQWTEQYLLYAYLLENRRTNVLFSSTYCLARMHEALTLFMDNKRPPGGGSLWFSQERKGLDL